MENPQKKGKVFERRRDTVKRKASELSSRCNVDVCVLCVGPTGELSSWPEDPKALHSVVGRYNEANNNPNKKRRRKETLTLADYQTPKSSQAEDDVSLSLPLSDEQLLGMSNDSLLSLARCLESKIQDINAQIELLTTKQASQQELNQGSFFSLPGQPVWDWDHEEQVFKDSEVGHLVQNFWGPMEEPNTGTSTTTTPDQTTCDVDIGMGKQDYCSFLDEIEWTEPFSGELPGRSLLTH